MGYKKTVILATLIVGLAFFAGPAAAEDGVGIRANSFHISPMLGWYMFENDQQMDDAATMGLGLGYNFTKNWGIELFGNYVDTEHETTNLDADAFMSHVDVIYHLMPDQNMVPYLVAGIGINDLDYDWQSDDTDWAINAGVGLKYFLTDTVALRADLRGLHQFGDPEWNLAAMVGLTFQFGGAAAAPPAECPDEDNDGVCDDVDKCPGTPAGAKVDADGCPLLLKEQVSIELRVEFDTAKAVVKPQYFDDIKRVAQFMMEYPLTDAVIEGHTDSRGSDSYNQRLSEQRANSVMAVLVDKFGVDRNRIKAVGFGESRPIADNNTAEGMQRNRRVVAVISAMKN